MASRTRPDALAWKKNPVDELEPLAAAKIPLLHVVGDADDVVPVAENTALIEARYTALGGKITVIHSRAWVIIPTAPTISSRWWSSSWRRRGRSKGPPPWLQGGGGSLSATVRRLRGVPLGLAVLRRGRRARSFPLLVLGRRSPRDVAGWRRREASEALRDPGAEAESGEPHARPAPRDVRGAAGGGVRGAS